MTGKQERPAEGQFIRYFKNGLEMLLAEIAFDQPGREQKPPG